MKPRSIFCFAIFFCTAGITISFAQSAIKEIDEKKEIMGIKLLAPPDYSQMKFLNTANDYSGNVYTLANNKTFKGSGYELSEAYILVNKGVVSFMWCPYPNNEDGTNIINDFSRSGLEVGNKILSIYFGKNLAFLAARTFNGKKCVAIQRIADSDSLPDVKDNSGMVELLRKKFSDPAVQQFISSLGKFDKKKFKDISYDLFFKNKGVEMRFSGKGDDAILWEIAFFTELDLYAKEDLKLATPYAGPLPYGITANCNPIALIDKFGTPKYTDQENLIYGSPEFSKFYVDANFSMTQSKENRKLTKLALRRYK